MSWEEKYELLEQCLLTIRYGIFTHEDTPEDPDLQGYQVIYLCTLMTEIIRDGEFKEVKDVVDAAESRLKEILMKILIKKSSGEMGNQTS